MDLQAPAYSPIPTPRAPNPPERNSDLFRFDPGTSAWTLVSDDHAPHGPSPRYGFGFSLLADGQLCVFGGVDAEGVTPPPSPSHPWWQTSDYTHIHPVRQFATIQQKHSTL